MKEWNHFLDELEKKLGTEIVQKWLRSLKVVTFDACNLYLEAQDSFQIIWFEEHIRNLVKNEFRNSNHHQIKIHLTTPQEASFINKRDKKNSDQTPYPSNSSSIDFSSDPLDPTATFDSFFISKKNQIPVQFLTKLAHISTQAHETIALGTFNPVYLWGKGSIGKTHLLMALASQVQKQNLRVKYVHAETFTMHVINAIRQSCMQEFRRSYRNLDVLLIDDVHLLARRTATQEEFFHTFNTLHSDGKQIVIASHSAPSQLDEIEQRLVSRFEWGLVLHLETMDETQKKDFLLARLSQANLIVSNEIASYLVGAFSTLKSLQMAIDALLLRTEAKKIDSLDCIMVCLKDLLENEKKQSLCPDDIIDAVATHFQLKASDLIGKSQTKECAYPRKVAMFLCRKELNLPYLTIGKLFSRDHSTVMTSVKGIEKQIKYQDTDLTHSITTIVTAFSK